MNNLENLAWAIRQDGGQPGLNPRPMAEDKSEPSVGGEVIDALGDNLLRQYLSLNLQESAMPLRGFLDQLERQAIVLALQLTGGHQRLAGKILGVKPNLLSIKIKKYRIHKKNRLEQIISQT